MYTQHFVIVIESQHNLPAQSSQTRARTEIAGPLAVESVLPWYMCTGREAAAAENRDEPPQTARSDGSRLPEKAFDRGIGAIAALRARSIQGEEGEKKMDEFWG